MKLSVALSKDDIVLAYCIDKEIEETAGSKIVVREIDEETAHNIARATSSNVRIALLREAIK